MNEHFNMREIIGILEWSKIMETKEVARLLV